MIPPDQNIVKDQPPIAAQTPTVSAAQSGAPGPVSYVPPAAPSVTPRAITTGETVEGRLSKLLSDDSPYVKQQEQKAVEYMAGRGGQNTTMAATAGRRAAIEGALPIAQQDAQTYSTAGQSSQEANQLITTEGYRGGISSALANQQGQQASALSAQEADQKIKLEQIAQQLTGDRQDKETYVKLASGVQQEYQSKYLAIQQTPDTVMNPNAKRTALDTLNRSTKSQMDMLDAVYKVNTTWSGGLSTNSGLPAASAPVSAASQAPTVTSQPVGAEPKPWEAQPSTSTSGTVGGVTAKEAPQSVINSGQMGAAENLYGLSTDPAQFGQELENYGAKQTDDYWKFQQAYDSFAPTYLPGETPTTETGWNTYKAVQYAIANPENQAAQQEAKDSFVRPRSVENYASSPAAFYPPFVDVNTLPPSQRQLSAWQEWVNRVIYQNDPTGPAAQEMEQLRKMRDEAARGVSGYQG